MDIINEVRLFTTTIDANLWFTFSFLKFSFIHIFQLSVVENFCEV